MAPKRIAYTWDVWRTSPTSWLVLLANKRTGDQLVYVVKGTDRVELLDMSKPLPDVRLFYPVVQRCVPPRARAIIRGMAEYDFDNATYFGNRSRTEVSAGVKAGWNAQTQTTRLHIPVEG